jgi:adenylyltransferase/sulfurtransferase
VAEEAFRDLTPEQLRDLIAQGRTPRLIDVRDPDEFAICRLPGAELLPAPQIADWIKQLDPEQEILVYCHHGIKSLHAVMQLTARGFRRVMYLRGGLDAYSLRADPSIPRY